MDTGFGGGVVEGGKGGGGGETEREKETDRQKQGKTETGREREAQTDRQTDRDREYTPGITGHSSAKPVSQAELKKPNDTNSHVCMPRL